MSVLRRDLRKESFLLNDSGNTGIHWAHPCKPIRLPIRAWRCAKGAFFFFFFLPDIFGALRYLHAPIELSCRGVGYWIPRVGLLGVNPRA